MKNMWILRFSLAILLILLSFAYIFVITLCPTAKQSDIILGFLLGTGLSSIIGFFFGSSDKKGKDSDEHK